ncbi:hypothetical protein GA0061098_104123 [Bradyrhizobium shewense]|uniref:Uncharacterized protein n=1 Tax=Bradyrhizobium shewense TaxID=1761772 RepID=A0A1C3XT40_9BRAD|nr:hypothetical protein GA0061098_104123 [Bradyrhizobium shewense]
MKSGQKTGPCWRRSSLPASSTASTRLPTSLKHSRRSSTAIPIAGSKTSCRGDSAKRQASLNRAPAERVRLFSHLAGFKGVLQCPANGSIVIDQNCCPGSTSFDSLSPTKSPLASILSARGQRLPSFRSAAHKIKSVFRRREVRNSCSNSDNGTKPVGLKTLVAVPVSYSCAIWHLVHADGAGTDVAIRVSN